jgi:hypothetical protein
MEIRKLMVIKEIAYSEGGIAGPSPVTRAIGLAVIRNPSAGRALEDLSSMFDIGAQVAEFLMPQLVPLLPRQAVAYGKGAIVGVNGDAEHAAAICHPRMGAPMRAAIGGGQAVIPSATQASRKHGQPVVLRGDRDAARLDRRRSASRRDPGRHCDQRWRPGEAEDRKGEGVVSFFARRGLCR